MRHNTYSDLVDVQKRVFVSEKSCKGQESFSWVLWCQYNIKVMSRFLSGNLMSSDKKLFNTSAFQFSHLSNGDYNITEFLKWIWGFKVLNHAMFLDQHLVYIKNAINVTNSYFYQRKCGRLSVWITGWGKWHSKLKEHLQKNCKEGRVTESKNIETFCRLDF
jgi:hypothetical protein